MSLRFSSIVIAACAALLCAQPAPGSTADDSCLEPWSLSNFQPKSPTFEQVVPNTLYRDRATIILLLASW